MKTKLTLKIAMAFLPLATITMLLVAQPSTALAQGTAFTYQGRLNDSGSPYTGIAEFNPTLWNAVSGGAAVATNAPVSVLVGVTNGLFVLPLNFGLSPFAAGAERWLQLELRTNLAAFTPIAPRQALTPTPYAITAGNLSGTLPTAQLSGQVLGAQIANGTVNAATVDSSQVQLRVTGIAPIGTFLTGITANGGISVAADSSDWKLGGNAGTTPATQFLGTTDNQPLELRVNGRRALRLLFTGDSVVDGGALDDGSVSIVGGSPANRIWSGSVLDAYIPVGSVIAGGGATNAFGSALPNQITADYGFIGGGAGNTVSAPFGSVVGGYSNTVSGYNATAMGSSSTASGAFSTAMGQYSQANGSTSFAGGRQAIANGDGCFFWADNNNFDFAPTGTNRFYVRSTGGVRFTTAIDGTTGGSTAGVVCNAGAGSWSSVSDRNAKEHFTPVDAQAMLAQVVAMPLTTWNYKSQDKAIRHIGPMAQDFKTAFGVGEDDLTIATIDADGVALAAIQGLNQKLEEREALLRQENAELKARLERLEQLLK